MPCSSLGLSLIQVSKSFGNTLAVNGVLFNSAPGEVVAVTGPSGAGKSTICRLIAGFESPDSGHIELAGRDITMQPPGARGIAYMFESYALYPHLSVFENAASPLRAPAVKNRLSESRIREIVSGSLEFLEIGRLADRLP